MASFQDWEYEAFRPLLIRELNRQAVAHHHLIRLRLYLYYNIDGPAKQGRIELFWIKFPALLAAALQEGRALPYPDDDDWIILPETLDKARQVYDAKSALYARWKEVTGTAGTHLEDLVREALRRANYLVGPPRTEFTCGPESIEFDGFTLAPLALGIEAKNKFSEVYYSPEVSGYRTEDLEQIENFFSICSGSNMIPILVASLVDRSFYSFQAPYKGLHCCLKFQLFPDKPKWRTLCDDIRAQLLVGNVQAWAEPPPHMQRWFDSIPTYYQRAYGAIS
jgi:hypothetical protein